MKKRFIQWGLVLTLVLQTGLLMAQDVSFDASVNRKQVELGSVIMLTLSIGGDVQAAPIDLPLMDGFQTRYVGPSSHISIHGSQVTRRHTFMYNLYPQKTGTLTIPSIKTVLNGQTYQTKPIEITVTDAGKAPAGNSGQSSLNDKIFTVMNVPKKDVYLNEAIPVTVKLFISELSVSNIRYPDLNTQGLKVLKFDSPNQYKQVIGGITYDVVEFSTTVYPTRTGKLTLGPAGIQCTLLFKKDVNSGGTGPRSIFDDDFFQSFFGAYDTKDVTLKSTDATLNVKPLPEEGKPKDFSGAVGQFDFDVTVSPNQVQVGDPITLRMRATGEGNMDSVEMPAIKENQDFKVYNPEITERDNMKILEQVVIPRHASIKAFPAVSFSYFDPKEGKYKTITKGPTALMVDPLKKDEALRTVGLQKGAVSVSSSSEQSETVGKDIRYIKEFPGRLQKRHQYLWGRTGFWLLVIITLLAWGGAVTGQYYLQKMATDQRFARRLRAPRQAREGLKQAEEFLQQERVKEFYESLYKTMTQYLANRFHVPPGAVNISSVRAAGESEGRLMEPSVLKKIEEVIKQCEGARFAGQSPDPARMREDLLRTREVIDHYQRR